MNSNQYVIFGNLDQDSKNHIFEILVSQNCEFQYNLNGKEPKSYLANLQVTQQQYQQIKMNQTQNQYSFIEKTKLLKNNNYNLPNSAKVVTRLSIDQQNLDQPFYNHQQENERKINEQKQIQIQKMIQNANQMSPQKTVDHQSNDNQKFVPLIQSVAPLNPQQIRPKKLNLKEFMRMIDEIYSYRFENKIQVSSHFKHQSIQSQKDLRDNVQQKAKAQDMTGKNLQEVTALFLNDKFKIKNKIDQIAYDIITSIEYHRQSSLEADLFYRFMTLAYTDQDLMFFLFARSLVERELQIKLTNMPISFDIRQLKISHKKVFKIALVYFENIAEGGIKQLNENQQNPKNLANNFVASLIKGAQETQQIDDELYDKLHGSVQVTFFLVKLLREFQTQQLMGSASGLLKINHSNNFENQQNYYPDTAENEQEMNNFEQTHEIIDQENQMERNAFNQNQMSDFQRQNLFQDQAQTNGFDDQQNEKDEQENWEIQNRIIQSITQQFMEDQVNKQANTIFENYKYKLNKKQIDSIKNDCKKTISSFLMKLLENLCQNDSDNWFELLQLQDPTDEDLEQFIDLTDKIEEIKINIRSNDFQEQEIYSLLNACQQDLLKEITQILQNIQGIKTQINLLISQMINQIVNFN